MFDGTLENYTGSKYKVELKEKIKLYHAKQFPIPKVHELTRKKDVKILAKIGILKRLFLLIFQPLSLEPIHALLV